MTSDWHLNVLFNVEIHAELRLTPQWSADCLEHIDCINVAAESHLVDSDWGPVEHTVLGPLLSVLAEDLVIFLPVLLIFASFEAHFDTPGGFFVVLENLYVSILRALLWDKLKALLVNVLHVVPPESLITVVEQLLMETNLAQVLHNNVLAQNEAVCGTV